MGITRLDGSAGTGRAALVYAAARLLLFALVTGLMWVAGVTNLLLDLLVGAALSGILSYVALARQREALAEGVIRHRERKAAEKAELRRTLDEEH